MICVFGLLYDFANVWDLSLLLVNKRQPQANRSLARELKRTEYWAPCCCESTCVVRLRVTALSHTLVNNTTERLASIKRVPLRHLPQGAAHVTAQFWGSPRCNMFRVKVPHGVSFHTTIGHGVVSCHSIVNLFLSHHTGSSHEAQQFLEKSCIPGSWTQSQGHVWSCVLCLCRCVAYTASPRWDEEQA